VQSFNPQHLQTLGRIHDREQAIQAVHQARAAGFDNINLDLMHGLPAQNGDDAMADLQQALALEPEHLSWYQLTIEPNTEFYKRPPQLPEDDTLAAIQERGFELLADAGFEHYEVSAFCRPGRASKHNGNYWEFGDYIGIGAGAHGKLTQRDGTIARTHKTRLPKDYLASAGRGGPGSGGFGGGGFGGGFGGPARQSASKALDVALTAPVSVNTIVIAVGLAVAGGLVAGAFGGWRASRLRPADALRLVE